MIDVSVPNESSIVTLFNLLEYSGCTFMLVIPKAKILCYLTFSSVVVWSFCIFLLEVSFCWCWFGRFICLKAATDYCFKRDMLHS